MKKLPFALAAALFASPVASGAAAAVKFIRVDEDVHAARLQTAVTRYEKDGATVDLIGAVHIADKAYYQDLDKRFEGYEALLFEMIGGEKFGANRPAADQADKQEAATPGQKPPPDPSALHQLYDLVARFLGLTGQANEIDYTKANFIHADLTKAEFDKLQKQRGESVVGFAMKAAEGGKQANQPDPAKLLKAMLAGESALMKLELVHTLGQGDDQIGALAGESVIISDRNRRCLEVLDRELKAGRTKIGIFYGAAHFVDMAKKLEARGFKRGKQEWLTAWDIPKPKPAAPKEPPAAAAREAA